MRADSAQTSPSSSALVCCSKAKPSNGRDPGHSPLRFQASYRLQLWTGHWKLLTKSLFFRPITNRLYTVVGALQPLAPLPLRQAAIGSLQTALFSRRFLACKLLFITALQALDSAFQPPIHYDTTHYYGDIFACRPRSNKPPLGLRVTIRVSFVTVRFTEPVYNIDLKESLFPF